jgi:hypothetical protein
MFFPGKMPLYYLTNIGIWGFTDQNLIGARGLSFERA